MKIINKKEFLSNESFFLEEMKKGQVFIYGTDTIYGIGCSALNSESVKKIRELKKRDGKPFSVIAPGKEWIRKSCFVSEKVEKWLAKLPGPYTLILELRNWEGVVSEVNSGLDSLGVRIPEHWFSKIVEKAGIPFVTTSVNISGEKNMTSLEDVDEDIKNKVDYVIDEGIKRGKASIIVNLTGEKEEVIER